MIHRVIVAIIIFFIFCIPYILFNYTESWWIKYMTNLLLKILNFRNIKINNAELFKLIKKTDKKVVIIANHKSIFDVFVLLYGLQDIGFMLSKNGGNMLPLINQIKKRSNSFFYEKGMAIPTLNEKIENRKANDNIIVVFADAMNPILPGYNIAPFKTGGFVGKFYILPIVIKYKNYTVDPTFRWFDGENPYIGFSKIALNDHIDVTLDVMDIQSCESNMSIEEYRDKVYNLMNKRYDEL